MKYPLEVLAAVCCVAVAAGTACGERDKTERAKSRRSETQPGTHPDAPADAHRPPTKGWEPVTRRYTGEEFLTWAQGEVDRKPVRVSPTLVFAKGYELNHHRVTVTFTGTGTVAFSLAHHTEDRLDEAVAKGRLHSPFRSLASGREVVVSTPLRSERCAWLIIWTTGEVKIAEIRHACWRGRGTVFGHSPGVFEFEGGKLPYRLMYPRNYDGDKAYPLVLSVHGSGGVGTDNSRSMENIILARYLFTKYYHDEELACFSLVTQIPSNIAIPRQYWPVGKKGAPEPYYHPDWPAVNENGWYTQATLALIRSLIAGKHINIDPDRVYFTGYSYGGKACWEFLKDDRTIFAAAMAGGGWPVGRAFSDPKGLLLDRLKLEVQRYKHVPAFVFAGERDPMSRGSRAVSEVIAAQGGKSRYVQFAKTGHVPAAAKAWGNRDNIVWLFKQNRKNNPEPGEDPFPGGVYPE